MEMSPDALRRRPVLPRQLLWVPFEAQRRKNVRFHCFTGVMTGPSVAFNG